MGQDILVVDDSADTAIITSRMLTKRGFTVRVAADGVRALELVAEQHPDCVLLDVMMPHMSGLEVLERLKHDTATAHIPVILLTARGTDDDVLSGYKEGADYYITKPFSAKQLLYGLSLVLGKQLDGTTTTAD